MGGGGGGGVLEKLSEKVFTSRNNYTCAFWLKSKGTEL